MIHRQLAGAPNSNALEEKSSPLTDFPERDFWPETDLRFAWHSILNECNRCLQQLSLDSESPGALYRYCSFAYSTFASFRMGMSGSASL